MDVQSCVWMNKGDIEDGVNMGKNTNITLIRENVKLYIYIVKDEFLG